MSYFLALLGANFGCSSSVPVCHLTQGAARAQSSRETPCRAIVPQETSSSFCLHGQPADSTHCPLPAPPPLAVLLPRPVAPRVRLQQVACIGSHLNHFCAAPRLLLLNFFLNYQTLKIYWPLPGPTPTDGHLVGRFFAASACEPNQTGNQLF